LILVARSLGGLPPRLGLLQRKPLCFVQCRHSCRFEVLRAVAPLLCIFYVIICLFQITHYYLNGL
jgi:hypothetical protein